MKRTEPCQPRGEHEGISLEGRLQVLHEVDLVHVAPRDRLPNLLDRRAVLARRPRALPLADGEALVTLRHLAGGAPVDESARGERERSARLRRWRRGGPA